MDGAEERAARRLPSTESNPLLGAVQLRGRRAESNGHGEPMKSRAQCQGALRQLLTLRGAGEPHAVSRKRIETALHPAHRAGSAWRLKLQAG